MFDTRPLRSATFRHLATGYWVNEFGNWLGEIALAILVFDRTGSPLATASLFLCLRLLPALLAPLLTARVETFRPRVTLFSLYVLEALFFGGMALLTRHFSFAVLLGLCALDGMLAITAKAMTRGVSATWLLKKDLLREGNAILNLGVTASSMLGPALAGVVVAWKGAGTALLADAATFLVTSLLILSAPDLRIESDAAAGFSGRLHAGIDVIKTHPTVRRLLIAIALGMGFGSIAVPIEVVFANQTLHAGDTGYGLILGAWGIGMVIGGAGFASAGNMRLVRLLGISASLTVLGYAGMAASPTLAVACIFSALGGTGNGAGWIAAVTALQERIPVHTQSAVMTVMEGINQVAPAFGFVAGGAITAASSPRAAYAASAAGIALVMIVIALRPIDQVRLARVAKDIATDIDTPAESFGHVPQLERNSSVNEQEKSPNNRTVPVTNA